MRTCASCGCRNPADAAFCAQCGGRLHNDPQTDLPGWADAAAWPPDPAPGSDPAAGRSSLPTQEWARVGQLPSTFEVVEPDPGRTNVLAVVAFVLSFFLWIVAIPFGHVALSQIRRTHERGRQLAVAALVLSYGAIFIVAVLIVTLLALNSPSTAHTAKPAGTTTSAAAPDPRTSGSVLATQGAQATQGQTTQGQGPPSTPAPLLPTPTPTPPPAPAPYVFVQQVLPVDDGGCATHATEQVQQVLAVEGCNDLSRCLFTTTSAGRPVLVSTASVFMPDPTSAPGFIHLITDNGTGDVATLIDDHDFYPGGPTAFAGDPTFLATPGRTAGEVLVLEAMWTDGRTTHADDPGLKPVLVELAGQLG